MQATKYQYVFSRFIYRKQVGLDHVCLYHTLTQRTVFVRTSCLERLVGANDGDSQAERAALLRLGFLVANDEVDIAQLKHLRFRYASNSPDIGVLYLLLTNACNFRCKYCFIDDGGGLATGGDAKFMSEDTARRALNLFKNLESSRNPRRRRKIYLYGGEPLLNFPLLERIEICLSSAEADITLITNGSLYSERISKFLLKHKINLVVSLDGPPEIHDEVRQTTSGEFTGETVVNNIRRYQADGVEPGISCTVSSANIAALNKFYSFVRAINVRSFSFNLLHGSCNRLRPPTRVATENLLKIFESIRSDGYYEDRIMRRVRSFVERQFWARDCAGYGRQIVIRPDGKVGPCQAFSGSGQFFEHTVDSSPDEIISSEVFNRWNRRLTLNNNECLRCPAIAICGGGCAYDAHQQAGDIEAIDRNTCDFVIEVLDWLLTKAFDAQKST